MTQLKEKFYDLTTYKGFNTSLDLLKKYGWILNPIPWLVYKALSPEISTEKQVDAAKKLILAGKETGVKRMKIKVNHKAGLEFGSMFEGIPIKANMGNSGEIELEIEYDTLENSSDNQSITKS